MIPADLLITDVDLLTMPKGRDDLGRIDKAALAIANGRIAWLGPRDLAATEVSSKMTRSFPGHLLTPGLIDCHTHLVFGGDRTDEWAQRIAGTSYSEIARQGGGILSTVRATRQASFDELLEAALARAECLTGEGVTSCEIKSGYGLELAAEQKMLRVAAAIPRHLPLEVTRTCLAAHAIPLEFKGRPDDYVRYVCDQMIPSLADSSDFADVFCEQIAFDVPQSQRVLEAAAAAGLKLKIHAEQLSCLGGAKMAAELGAVSADHLEYLDQAGAAAMAQSQTVAVLLPGAFYFINETHHPPVPLLRNYQIPIALATDCNPGSSPFVSLLTVMNMACTLFGLTVEEVLRGVTVIAAAALDRQDLGSLAIGKQADLAIWEARSPAQIFGEIGRNRCRAVFKRGRPV